MRIEYLQTPLCEITISRPELYRTMGYGDVTPESDICDLCEELIEEAMGFVKPAFCYLVSDNCEIDKESISFEGVNFQTDKTIASLLRKSEELVFFIATAGAEYQAWHDEVTASHDALRLFVLDSLGSVIVESMGDYMEDFLQKQIGDIKHTNRFSPGYCSWRIEEQQKLFPLFKDGNCGVTLNENSLMHPIKSISGVIGTGRDVITKRYGCSICKRTDCYLRRV